jgi:type 1 glutamine amidotransferase/HEAT repeat protein
VEKRFVDFVRNGKGLIGVHAATDCLYKWPEYGDMMGGFFNSHPWNENVTVKLDDPGHPLLRAFRGQSFVVADEIYQFKEPYSRDKLRVLLSIDVNGTDMTKKNIRRTDGDFAVAWIHRYGKGRVFYFSLGHRPEIFWNEPVMQCYLDGIQYALGDLTCDDTPSSQLSPAYLAKSREIGYEQGVAAVFRDLAGYEMGVNDNRAKLVARMVLEAQKAGSANQADLSARLAKVAADSQATPAGRVFACRQLMLIGQDNAVATLAGLLNDKVVGGWSRRALEAIPGQTVDGALLQALGQTKGAVQAGVADSLGARGVAQAVPALIPLLGSADATVAVSAANALGRIGGSQAVAALQAAKPGKAAVQEAVVRAVLCAAEADRAAGRKAPATVEYAWLAGQAQAPAYVKAAAFYGKAMCTDGLADALAAAKSTDREMVRVAANLVRDLPGKAVGSSFAKALPALPVGNQALILDALADRGDRVVQPAVIALAKSPAEDVRLAALRALAKVGDAQAVSVLMSTAGDPEAGASAKVARESLMLMTPTNVDPALIAALRTSADEGKVAIVEALGLRKAHVAVPALLGTARSTDRKVSKESRKSLAMLATPADLPEIVKLLAEQKSASARGDLENILIAVAKRIDDDGAKTAAILPALKGDLPVKARASLLDVLGRVGAESGLPALYAALDDSNADVQRAAVKTLAESWPTSAPMERLRTISRTSDNMVMRVLSLRGYARMLALPSKRSMKETLGLYKEALGLAKGDQEKRTLITGLGHLCHPDALDFVKPYLKDEGVKSEALLAALKITQSLDGQGMTFNASNGHGSERNAVDGTRDTRWTSGKAMTPGMWFQVNLGYETDIKSIWLDAGPVGTDYPRSFEVYVSLDGENWGKPVVTSGDRKEKVFTIDVPPTYGRFVKIVQTGSTPSNFWSIAEMRINGRPSATGKEELDRSKWKVTASRGDAPENAIDGDLKKRWGTGGGMKPTDWLQVDLGEEKTVYRVVLNAAQSRSDFPRQVRVMYSMDGKTWDGPIGAIQGSGPVTSIVLLPTKTRFLRIKQTGSHDTYWWSVYDLKIFGE